MKETVVYEHVEIQAVVQKKIVLALTISRRRDTPLLIGWKKLTYVVTFANLSRVCVVWTEIRSYNTTVIRLLFKCNRNSSGLMSSVMY